MEVYAAQIDRMDQGIGRILRALEETGELQYAADVPVGQWRLRQDIPVGVTAEELCDQLLIAQRTTRDGRPVRFGNDRDIVPGPGHLSELRDGLGQPLELALPPLQALHPRGRHLDPADHALAGGHVKTGAACGTCRDSSRTSWPRSWT